MKHHFDESAAGRKLSAPPPPSPMAIIAKLTEDYAKSREDLSARVSALEAELSTVRRRRIAGIKSSVAVVNDRRALLEEALLENKRLFVKPRSKTFSGIQVGFRKLVGSITFDDAAAVVARIKKLFPDQKDVLVKTTETPVKAALQQLTGEELKKLGVTVEADSDELVIKAKDSEVEKLVDALLQGDDDGGDA